MPLSAEEISCIVTGKRFYVINTFINLTKPCCQFDSRTGAAGLGESSEARRKEEVSSHTRNLVGD